MPLVEWLLDKASKMPREANRKLAEIVGRIWYRLDDRHRTIALRNLELAFGKELDEIGRKEICRRVFDHFARVILEVPYLLRLDRSNIEEFALVSGTEHFDAALSKGKGVLVLASHFGNWEIMSLAFSIVYAPIHVIVRPLDNPFLDRLITGIRCRTGNRVIPKKGSVRKVLRVIREPRSIVALLIDQNVDWYDGVFVPFFKEIACTNKALAVLALRTGIPVVPVFNYRLPDGRYYIYALPEVPLIRTGDLIRDTEENMTVFNRIIEEQVRSHPEQWFWLHQRWKTRPFRPWPRT